MYGPCHRPVVGFISGYANITDSVYVVFYEPTGNFGAMIQVNMTYKENEDSRFVKRGSTEARKVYVTVTDYMKYFIIRIH